MDTPGLVVDLRYGCCIETIKKSGLNYKVCAMSTCVEGDTDKLFKLAHKCHKIAFEYGAQDVITQIRIHESKIFDDTIKSALVNKLIFSGTMSNGTKITWDSNQPGVRSSGWDGNSSTVTSPAVGEYVIATGGGTTGRDHIVVTAEFTDGTKQVVLDTYV